MSDGAGGISRFAAATAAWLWMGAMTCPSSEALQQPIQAKVRNYPNAPVTVQASKVMLVETYATPTQVSQLGGSGRKSRVRYANRAGLSPSARILDGEVVCMNRSPQAVEALQLTIVLLDAFHGVIAVPGQRQALMVQQIVKSIPKGSSDIVQWEQRADVADVYEVAVMVTGVRFADGSVWLAPKEELIDIF